MHLLIIEEKRHAFDESLYFFSVDPEVMIDYIEVCIFENGATVPDCAGIYSITKP